MKKLILLYIICFISCAVRAQVTAGSGIEPVKGALLDLKEKTPAAPATDNSTATRGLLLPRLNLTAAGQLYPMFESTPGSGTAGSDYDSGTEKSALDALHIGLTVYNLTDNCTFCPGVYAWDGALWQRLQEPCCPCLQSVITGAPQELSVYQGETPTLGPVTAVYDDGLVHATAYQWYSSPAQGQNTGGTAIAGATGPVYTLAAAQTSAAGAYYFYCEVSNTCRAESLPSGVYTVNVTGPRIMSAEGGDVCYPGGEVTLTATTSPGASIRWWSAATGGTLLHTGDTYKPSITANTSYWVEAHRDHAGGGYTSARVKVDAILVNERPTVTNTSVTVCVDKEATLSATTAEADCVIEWYDAATGGNLAGSGAAFTTPVLTETNPSYTYYAATRNTVTGCISQRVAVTARLQAAPMQPVLKNNRTYLRKSVSPLDGSVSWTLLATALRSSNNSIRWYDAATGGNLLPYGTSPDYYYVIPANCQSVTYYAAEVDNSCGRESTRLPVPFDASDEENTALRLYMEVHSSGMVLRYSVQADYSISPVKFGMSQVFKRNGSIEAGAATDYGAYSPGTNDHVSIRELPPCTAGNEWESECFIASSCGGDYLRLVFRSYGGNATCKVYNMSGTLLKTHTVPWDSELGSSNNGVPLR
jgi:hypothetical protein